MSQVYETMKVYDTLAEVKARFGRSPTPNIPNTTASDTAWFPMANQKGNHTIQQNITNSMLQIGAIRQDKHGEFCYL
jgi:hypothetical protein